MVENRNTVTFGNETLIKLNDRNEENKWSLKKKCGITGCLFLSYALFYGLGFYCGYIMEKNNLDCSDGSSESF